MEYEPEGVDVEVNTVSVEVQSGVHDGGENEYVAPEGRPDAEKETGAIDPDTPVAVTAIDADRPAVTSGMPLTDSEKLKGMALLTFIGTPTEVPWFPAKSLATAVSM